MPITFDKISPDTRVPGSYSEVDNSAAAGGIAAFRCLVMGQRLSTGTVAAAIVKKVSSRSQAEAYFGRGSMLAEMIAAFLAVHPTADLSAVALDDVGGGTKTIKQMTVTGPATANGTVYLYVAGKRIPVAVTKDQTAAQVASAINTALEAAEHGDLPMTFAVNGVDAFKIDGTARHKGELGDNIDIRFNYGEGEAFPAGISITVATTTPGATDPDVSTAITALGGEGYRVIATPWADDSNLDDLETHLASMWDPPDQLYGHAFSCVVDVHGDLLTAGNARNSPHSTVLGLAGGLTPPWITAAELAAACAQSLEAHPSRPLRGLRLPRTRAPAVADRFTWTQRNLLLKDGISTVKINEAGEVYTERVITTYQVNSNSAPDTSFLQVETVFTLMLMRDELRNLFETRYNRHMLADDESNPDPGVPVMKPIIAKAEYVALGRSWERRGMMENLEQFKQQILSERNAGDQNRLDALLRPDLINQFFVHAVKLQFLA